jgi:hypothetical protein
MVWLWRPDIARPSDHRPRVETKGRDDSLQRTAVGEQGHHERYGLDQLTQPIEWSPFGYSEAPGVLSAAEALALPRVDARVALNGFPSSRAAQIRQNVDVGPR